ncbi:hypothetical protein COU59_02475 [Candidatus Pacearchaeota archaeon CG10_big_fil_rev_8_21_14_0_10_34_12]|nr:MAG: hypothetical protein COU59_02475 [Candidatus Pacearchaeota archaeon CG10_big_fil_rev_8_21_14_0_10_34_12]
MEEQMSIYYDEEGDYLEITFGVSDADYGYHVSEDIVLFKDQKTEKVLGVGIFNFKKRTKDFSDLKLKLPFKINLSQLNA